MLDAAGLNDLVTHTLAEIKSGKQYFAKCAECIDLIKRELRKKYGLVGELYLLSNTSTIFVLVAHCLGCNGISLGAVVGIPFGSYSLTLDSLNSEVVRLDNFTFVTHVEALSGNVQSLGNCQGLVFVDAAQSFATSLQTELNSNQIMFMAPLHKHSGLIPGLALMSLPKAEESRDKLSRIRNALETAERGSRNLEVLLKVLFMVQEGSGLRLNLARILVTHRLELACDKAGVMLLTNRGIQSHSFSVIVDAGHDLFVKNALQQGARFFQKNRIVRWSFHSDFNGKLKPEEYEDLSIAKIEEAAGNSNKTL